MREHAVAFCLSGLGLAAGLGILLSIEPGWLARWLYPEPVEVPTAAGQS
jgi:hypothetical protein